MPNPPGWQPNGGPPRSSGRTAWLWAAVAITAIVAAVVVVAVYVATTDAEKSPSASGSGPTTVVMTTAPADDTPESPAGLWTDPVVVVTPNSVGAAQLGMTEEQIEAVAGVQLNMPCTQCDARPTADLPENYPWYTISTWRSSTGVAGEIAVSLYGAVEQTGQVVETADGFRLGDSVDELLRIYGDRLQPYESLGLYSVRGYVLAGDGGYLVFNTIESNGVGVHEFVVREDL